MRIHPIIKVSKTATTFNSNIPIIRKKGTIRMAAATAAGIKIIQRTHGFRHHLLQERFIVKWDFWVELQYRSGLL